MSIEVRTGAWALALTTALVTLAGCSVDPPLPLEADPAHLGVALRADERPHVRVGLAPTLVSLRGPSRRPWAPSEVEVAVEVAAVGSAHAAAVASGGVAAVTSGVAERARGDDGPGLPPREYAWSPPHVDGPALDARLSTALGWALSGEALPRLEGRGDDAARLLRAADDAGLDLLVQAEVRDARAAWVGRAGAAWWVDALVFYGLGLPLVMIENETYEAALRASVTVVHARSGRALLERTFVARAERALNDPQRGWDLGGLFFLHPYTLDDDDLAHVHEALHPHAVKDLERQAAAWLRDALPARLREPGVRALLQHGDPSLARVFALVVGAAGPQVSSLDRPPPLLAAERDAREVERVLRASGDVPAERLVTLTGAEATRGRALAALERLGRRMVEGDRLIFYYAGYGWFDPAGDASLLLDGEAPLSLRALAEHAARAVPGQVTFVLDTSFGGTGGRTFPGAPTLPDGALLPLTARPTWRALVASAPGQVAHEDAERGGLLTRWLLTGLRGPADADGDGGTSWSELETYARTWVRAESLERAGEAQLPTRVGAADDAPFLRVVAELEPR